MVRLVFAVSFLAALPVARADAPTPAKVQTRVAPLMATIARLNSAAPDVKAAELATQLAVFAVPATFDGLRYSADSRYVAPAKTCQKSSVVGLFGSTAIHSTSAVPLWWSESTALATHDANGRSLLACLIVPFASFHYDNDETVYLVIGAIEDAGAIKIDTILITPAM